MASEAQSTHAVLLVRPASFGFHAEAAASNVFASATQDPDVAAAAMREFDSLSRRLSDAEVEVVTLEDPPDPAKPDAIFPNNWVSFHADGTMVLYPMATEARRLERNAEGLQPLLASAGFEVRRTIDLSGHEREGRFLEGTGSLILDRPQRRAYVALGPRTDPDAVADFEAQLGYSAYCFEAADPAGRPIYHTNVLLSLGTRWAMVCLESVAPGDRQALAEALESSGRKLIDVTFAQLRGFACNIIELRRARGETLIAMSAAARESLTPDQRRTLEDLGGELVDVPIPTIEQVGGGSVRCMIADIHLPRVSRDS